MAPTNSKLYRLYSSLKAEILNALGRQGFGPIEKLEIIDYEGELIIFIKTTDGLTQMMSIPYKEQK
mgnify:CR=1 FL=1